MWRILPVCGLLFVVSSASWSDGAPAPTETVIRMTVQPMAEPKPALKYQLLPELREMNPGNPIQGYLKCFMEQNYYFYNKQGIDQREKWSTMPLSKLPVKELRDYGGGIARQADYAARLDTPDWQILLKLKSDGINLLLPEVQSLRRLGEVLKVRFRGAVAERRFDDAVVTAKTMFALSRHLGEHPTNIGELIGTAVAFLTIGPLEEMIPQPGCPNLFWALTNLPSPFIDLRKAVQGERMSFDAEFAVLDAREPMSDAQLQRAVDHFQQLMEKNKDVKRWLDGLAKNEDHLRAARQRLIASGSAEADVKKFPARQVLLLDEKREYETRRDEWLKLISLPYWQAQPILTTLPQPRDDDPTMLFAPFLFRYGRIKWAQTRLEQRLSLLRCVEALRLYAADHKGKLPDSLDDIYLPLPVDPVTGKPFIYKLNDRTAVLHGIPPGGTETNPAFNVRYEVTIGK